jgi:hypothetical protein
MFRYSFLLLKLRLLTLTHSMPGTELVRSNHQDVVDVACFEGKSTLLFYIFLFISSLAKINIHQFDDRKCDERHITISSWYTRYTIAWRNGVLTNQAPKLSVCPPYSNRITLIYFL